MAEENFSEIKDPVERVRAYLASMSCKAQVFHTEDTIFTVGDASRAVGAPPEKILKSMLFSVDDGERWVLALMSGPNKVHDRKLKHLTGARKVRMGSADAVFAYCGFEPGGVPPVGYAVQPETLLDADLFQYDVVWGAAGTEHDFFPIAPDELQRITSGKKADIKKDQS